MSGRSEFLLLGGGDKTVSQAPLKFPLVVKIMDRFWIPITMRHLIFRVPEEEPSL